MPSSNPSAKWVKTRFDQASADSVSDDASSEPSQIEVSIPSPNYLKATSNSDASKESPQASFHNPEENESDSWKPNTVSFAYVKPLGGNSRRVLSLKTSKPLKKRSSRMAPFPNLAGYAMPHQEGEESDRASVGSCSYGSTSSTSSAEESGKKRGETETRKTLKKSRSIRVVRSRGSLKPKSRFPKSRFDHPSPNYLKATSCSEGKKTHSQASHHDFESSSCSVDESWRNSHAPKSNSGASSLKSMQTLKRIPSLRPVRILMNKSSFKSRKNSVKKCSHVAEESSVHKPTCSSTLKGSKFPHPVEEIEPERISVAKVCPYNYCSLHGHHHSSTPPLKRLLSKRRRMVKTQKSMKPRRQSSLRGKRTDDLMRLIETSKMVVDGEAAAILLAGEEDSDLSAQRYAKPLEFFGRSSEGSEDTDLAEVHFGETSYPEEEGVQENLNRERNFVTTEPDVLQVSKHGEETKFESCCIAGSSLISLEPDNSFTNSCDEVPSSNLGFCELENADFTGISGEASDIYDNDMGEVREDNSVSSSASVCHTPEFSAARDEEHGDLAADQEIVGQIAPVGDSEHSSAAREVHVSPLNNRKHLNMWHLIRQHMVSGGAKTQLLEGEDEEKQMDDTDGLPAPQSSGCSVGTECHDTDNEDIEIRKMHAIKMVREAIENILLPEVQDQPSDDQSISGDFTSEQYLLEKNNDEVGNLSLPNSTADTPSGPEQEVKASEEEKTEKKTPKSWSNLKKLILLKRFIKALEKVRKFNPQKTQHLPLEPGPEAEKVILKRQMIDRKRSSEEWMLDYALQQVISELAPTEKRKVLMLIKAFETVVPPSDEQQILVKIDRQSTVSEDRIPKFDLVVLKVDSASSRQNLKVDGSSGVTGDEEPAVTDTITSPASEDGPFKQRTVVGEVKNKDLDSHEQLTSIHNQKSILTEFCKEDDPNSDIEKLETGNLAGAPDGLPSIKERATPDDNADAAAANAEISTACDCGALEELTAAREQKSGDSEQDNESIEGFGSVRDSEPDNSGHRAKHIGMWQLIHQHMVAGLAEEAKTTQLNKENEEHVGDVNTLAAAESSGSCPDVSTSFQNKGMECHGMDSQEVELRKMFAIKMVREAIEKILLPEVQDQSSDDQSITSEILPDQEPKEPNHGEGGEPSISSDSDKDHSIACYINKDDVSVSQERTRLATADVSELETEKTIVSKDYDKSDKKTPKGWSNLKKLILLNRFIKQLEKVRKFNPKKPRHLQLKPDPEAEEVSLRHQTIEERKGAEEWMLDYALQKVVSELAPKQKRKVALLVKAFETVAPTSDEPQIQVTFPQVKDANLEYCSQSEQDAFVCKTTEADRKVKDNGDNHYTITDGKSNVAVDEEDQKETHEETVSSLELLKDGSASNCKNMKLYTPSDGIRGATKTYNISSSASPSESLEQVMAKKGISETDCTAAIANKTQLDKQKHITMWHWHLLCQHVVSDIATKVESQIVDVEDADEKVNGAKTSLQTRTSSCHDSRSDHHRGEENHDSTSPRIGFSQTDAVKLVREAIKEILSPEIQDDSSDAQSVASDSILEQELTEKNQSILTSIDSPKDCSREYEKSAGEVQFAADNIPPPDEQRTVSMMGNKSDQQKPKNWSKLKKLILLKRSIKALEKARKSSIRAPQNLPLKPDTEEEKVNLRHQRKDEKKKAEEWMLDYALQHVVTTLTPARKRRVSMLVEAFEAVVPLPEV